MSESQTFAVELEQEQDYRFSVRFDWPAAPDLTLDAGPPLGGGTGPDSERLLAAAVGNCLSASLLFSLRKFKQAPGPMRTRASGTLVRNEKGRLRIGELNVEIRLSGPAGALAHVDRSVKQFEDFCTVTSSVRQGIPVKVRVLDGDGVLLHEA